MREAIRRSSKAIKRKAEVRSSRMRTGILFVSKPTRSELAGSHPECITRDFFLFRIQASSSSIASASPSLAFFAAAAASAASSSGESLCEIRPPRGDHHGYQGPSRAIKSHQGPSRAIKGHQGRLREIAPSRDSISEGLRVFLDRRDGDRERRQVRPLGGCVRDLLFAQQLLLVLRDDRDPARDMLT